MAIYLIPSRPLSRSRPDWPFRLNYDSPQAAGLYRWWPLSGGSQIEMRTQISATGTRSLGGSAEHGLVAGFNGTSDALQAAVDLSAFSVIGLSFWMNWTAFANNDDVAFELTANANSNAGSFYINPSSTSSFAFDIEMGVGDSTQWIDSFSRPSAGVWHHYLLRLDRATPLNTAWVDGVSVAVSLVLHNISGALGNFANSTLNFMSRNNTALFGPGNMADVRIYTALPTDAGILARALYAPATRWDLYAPPSRSIQPMFSISAAGQVWALAGNGGGLVGPPRGLAG